MLFFTLLLVAVVLFTASRASTQQSSVNLQSVSTTGANPPNYPTGTAESGPADGQITLRWTPATSGHSVTGWSILWRQVGSSTYPNTATLAAGARTHTINGLDKSLRYDVRLVANSSTGLAITEALNIAAVASTPPPTASPPPPPP
ncbi:MAG: fibronectin type III domain-containing protein, partial [Candidatus Dadabacteria bacterium]|nr:fibronectin type III domain-containing protein [Candidatus Dadabacteria bacterium]